VLSRRCLVLPSAPWSRAAALNRVEPGYDPTGVVAARVSLPTTGYEAPDQARSAFERLSERVAVAPGVTASGLASVGPLEGGGMPNAPMEVGWEVAADPGCYDIRADFDVNGQDQVTLLNQQIDENTIFEWTPVH